MGKIEDGCLCIQCGPNGTQLLPLAMAATVIKTMSAQETIFIKTMSAQDIIFIKTMSAQDKIFIKIMSAPYAIFIEIMHYRLKPKRVQFRFANFASHFKGNVTFTF